MRIALATVACLLLLLCPAAARDEPAQTPAAKAVATAADEVVKVVEAGNDGALEYLAGKDTPDPWIVVEELCARGLHDVADAFAKAAPRPAVAELPAYVVYLRERGPDVETRKQWQELERAIYKRDAKAILAKTASLPEEWSSVTAIRLGHARGTVLSQIKRSAEAVVVLQHAANAAEALGWIERAVSVRLRAARYHHRLGDAPKSLVQLEAALRLLRVMGDRERAVGTALNAGMLHNALGDHAKCLEVLTQGLRDAEAVGNQQWIANTLGNMGNAHFGLGDYAQALDHYRRGLALNEELKNAQGVAQDLSRIGQVYLQFGDYTQSLAHHERARDMAAANNDMRALAQSNRFLGNLYSRLGDFSKALDYTEDALELAEKTRNKRSIAGALHGLGSIHKAIGDEESARAFYERAHARYAEVENKTGVAAILVNLGILELDAKRYDEALAFFTRAQPNMEARGDKYGRGRVLSYMASVHAKREAYSKALELEEQALVLFEEVGHRAAAVETRAEIGILKIELGMRPEGLKLLGRAVRTARHLHDRSVLVWCLWNIAAVHLEGGEPMHALARAREAMHEIEHLVGGLAEEQGAIARGQRSGLFDIGAAAATQVGDAAELVTFLEAGRAGALLETLNARQSMRWAEMPERLRQEEARARADLTKAHEQDREARISGNRKAQREAAKALDEAAARLRDVTSRLQREAKGRAATALYPRAAPLEDIQERLQADEALVLYNLPRAPGVDEAVAVVVTRNDERIVKLGPASEVGAACAALRASEVEQSAVPALTKLRRLLVTPLALDKTVKRVLVSPEGALCCLPLGALFDRSVAFTPSGTAHAHLLAEVDEPGSRVLALGDPVYSNLQQHARLAYVRGGELVPLPATRAEATAVGDDVLLGADATEPAFRKLLGKQTHWRAVHFACHGLVDPEHPTLSALALSRTEDSDGFLTAIDVLNMDIPTNLTVLSACDTGKGKIIQGEGIVGLTRAFMFAGSPRVLCSLWKVDDAATKALMVKFYELWNPRAERADPEGAKRIEGAGKKGLGAAAALKAAQEYVRRHEKWKHPYYWAAWVLWGLPE